jgi:hypothetical protein
MKWIWVQWVFSGIGVAVLGFLGRWLFRRDGQSAAISANRSSVVGSPVASGSNISQTVNLTTVNPAPTVNPALQIKGDYSEKPTPADIENQLDALPAFQRNKMKDDYVGLKVSWPVSVSSLFEVDEFIRKWRKVNYTHTILARYGMSVSQVISVDVDIERFPRLKFTHDGTRLRISGTISEVSSTGNVTLKDVEIEFDE